MAREYAVAVRDPRNDSDEQIAERIALHNEMLAEVLPGEQPARAADAIAASRALPERIERWLIEVRDGDGRLVGMASTAIDRDHEDNPDLLWVSVAVRQQDRRRGVGSLLLAELVAIAEDEGRTRLLGQTEDVDPGGEAFALAAGAVTKSRSHVNRLLTEKVDRAQLESWVADAATRAAGYELIGWDGDVADEDMDRWIDLVLVMNTAPRDDVDQNDFTLTPEEVRDGDRRRAAVGTEEWVLVARTADGTWTGFHDVSWHEADPTIVWVGATAVRPEHRGHALGKWLKAAMTLRILDVRPQVTEIRTGNADSNDAMLGINRAMGYEPWIAGGTWEVEVATARSVVDRTRGRSVLS